MIFLPSPCADHDLDIDHDPVHDRDIDRDPDHDNELDLNPDTDTDVDLEWMLGLRDAKITGTPVG